MLLYRGHRRRIDLRAGGHNDRLLLREVASAGYRHFRLWFRHRRLYALAHLDDPHREVRLEGGHDLSGG